MSAKSLPLTELAPTRTRAGNPMAEVEDLKSFQCGFDPHPAYVFKVIDITTGQEQYVHEGKGFKQPYVNDGNLHWYSYCDLLVLASSNWNMDKVVLGMFNAWCEQRGYKTESPVLYKRTDPMQVEFEVIAPLLEG